MKQFHLKAFALFLLLLPLCVARGQSVVTEVQYAHQDTSIVRYWKNGISIVYTQTWYDDNYFYLVDSATTQVLMMAVGDAVKVNDFRILHDTVYMGGHYIDGLGTKKGWLGFFAIQDFYTGSGNYYCMAAQATIMPDCYGGCFLNQIDEITRLAVYDDAQMGVQIAYIGKNHIVGETLQRVGIGWATYYMGSWSNNIIYNKHAKEEYSDIIATQNYVVALGRDNVNAHLALRIFPKSSFLIPTWVPYPGAPGAWCYHYNTTGQEFADLNLDNDVMATALDGDEFAVAYHYTSSPKDGLAVKTFGITSGMATLLQGLNAQTVRQPGSTWKMRDIGYSLKSGRLMVLNDFDGGTVGNQQSIVYQFPLPALTAGTYYGRYLPGYNLHALAPFGTMQDAFVATGNVIGDFSLSLYWEKYTASTSCGLQDAIDGKPTTAAYETPNMATNMNVPTPSPWYFPFSVQVVEKNMICSQP